MSRANILLVCAFLLALAKIGSGSGDLDSLGHSILPYWSALGWKNVTAVSDGDLGIGFLKAASAAMVKVSVGKVGATTIESGAVTFVGYSPENVALLKDMLRVGRPPYSCLIAGYHENQNLFNDEFKRFNVSSGFFRILKRKASTSFFRVQTFRDQDLIIQNEWTLRAGNDGFIEEVFDLQGAPLTSITKSWQPWLRVYDCQPGNRNCKTSGLLHEMMDLLAKRFNFTLVTTLDDDWGTVPKSGNYSSPDAVWAGVFGGIVNSQYMSVSVWIRSLERDQLFADFTDSFYSRHVSAVLNINKPPVDITLFLRPFTVNSWLVLVAATFFISVVAMVPFWILGRAVEEDSNGKRIAALSGWAFFLLVNAYYGGALTMFFTSPESIPFETIRQGMTLYPDWKMVVNKGSVIHIQKHEGDPLYTRYWEIMQDEALGLIQPTMKGALRKLLEPGHFLITGSHLFVIENYLEMNEPGLDLRFLRKEEVTSSTIALSDNSPVAKMLNKGITILRQSGTLDTIIRKGSPQLPGASGGGADNVEQKVLGGRHLGLIFFFYAAVGCATVPILVLEKASKMLIEAVFIPMYRRLAGKSDPF